MPRTVLRGRRLNTLVTSAGIAAAVAFFSTYTPVVTHMLRGQLVSNATPACEYAFQDAQPDTDRHIYLQPGQSMTFVVTRAYAGCAVEVARNPSETNLLMDTSSTQWMKSGSPVGSTLQIIDPDGKQDAYIALVSSKSFRVYVQPTSSMPRQILGMEVNGAKYRIYIGSSPSSPKVNDSKVGCANIFKSTKNFSRNGKEIHMQNGSTTDLETGACSNVQVKLPDGRVYQLVHQLYFGLGISGNWKQTQPVSGAVPSSATSVAYSANGISYNVDFWPASYINIELNAHEVGLGGTLILNGEEFPVYVDAPAPPPPPSAANNCTIQGFDNLVTKVPRGGPPVMGAVQGDDCEVRVKARGNNEYSFAPAHWFRMRILSTPTNPKWTQTPWSTAMFTSPLRRGTDSSNFLSFGENPSAGEGSFTVQAAANTPLGVRSGEDALQLYASNGTDYDFKAEYQFRVCSPLNGECGADADCCEGQCKDDVVPPGEAPVKKCLMPAPDGAGGDPGDPGELGPPGDDGGWDASGDDDVLDGVDGSGDGDVSSSSSAAPALSCPGCPCSPQTHFQILLGQSVSAGAGTDIMQCDADMTSTFYGASVSCGELNGATDLSNGPVGSDQCIWGSQQKCMLMNPSTPGAQEGTVLWGINLGYSIPYIRNADNVEYRLAPGQTIQCNGDTLFQLYNQNYAQCTNPQFITLHADGSSNSACSAASGGTSTSGGSSTSAGSNASGGTNASGGSNNSGGSNTSGGTNTSGGSNNSGGSYASGGTNTSGGSNNSGGSNASGGTNTSGGSNTSGNSNASGGSNNSGGTNTSGGSNNSGGSHTSGSTGSNGSTPSTCANPGNVCRLNLDPLPCAEQFLLPGTCSRNGQQGKCYACPPTSSSSSSAPVTASCNVNPAYQYCGDGVTAVQDCGSLQSVQWWQGATQTCTRQDGSAGRCYNCQASGGPAAPVAGNCGNPGNVCRLNGDQLPCDEQYLTSSLCTRQGQTGKCYACPSVSSSSAAGSCNANPSFRYCGDGVTAAQDCGSLQSVQWWQGATQTCTRNDGTVGRCYNCAGASSSAAWTPIPSSFCFDNGLEFCADSQTAALHCQSLGSSATTGVSPLACQMEGGAWGYCQKCVQQSPMATTEACNFTAIEKTAAALQKTMETMKNNCVKNARAGCSAPTCVVNAPAAIGGFFFAKGQCAMTCQ